LGFDAGDVNLYRYVGNGPTNGVDPSGQEFTVGGQTYYWPWESGASWSFKSSLPARGIAAAAAYETMKAESGRAALPEAEKRSREVVEGLCYDPAEKVLVGGATSFAFSLLKAVPAAKAYLFEMASGISDLPLQRDSMNPAAYPVGVAEAFMGSVNQFEAIPFHGLSLLSRGALGSDAEWEDYKRTVGRSLDSSPARSDTFA
jgi:hypothetical protein